MDKTALKAREMNPMTTKISLVKQRVSNEVWAERIHDCRASGLTVAEYCRQNELAPKTYYYHLRKLREQLCCGFEEQTEMQTPVRIGELPSTVRSATVTVCDVSGITVEIEDGTSVETIKTIIQALKC